MTISIGLIEAHPMFRAALSALLTSSGFTVIAEGASADDAKEISAKHTLDILIIDHVFLGLAEIAAKGRVVIFAATHTVEHALMALDFGAMGYILKTDNSAEILHGLKQVHMGESFITHHFAPKVIAALRNASTRKLAIDAIKLSVREQQIVRLLFKGASNKEIARNLTLSEQTVKHYMGLLMEKLSARNRLEVLIAAQKLNGEDKMAS